MKITKHMVNAPLSPEEKSSKEVTMIQICRCRMQDKFEDRKKRKKKNTKNRSSK